MNHSSRQPMPPSSARITMLEAENEALRRRVAELEAQIGFEPVTAKMTVSSRRFVPVKLEEF